MGGDIIKPIKYHIGEWEALQWFTEKWAINDRILDVGCGVGYGTGMIKLLGINDVVGIDINPDKITVGRRLGYSVESTHLMNYHIYDWFDVIWCSHAFEHMENADSALKRLMLLTRKRAKLCFVLPYPDFDPAPAHTASKEIGLDIDDEGQTVIDWFTNHGLFLNRFKFDSFREKEIWLEFEK